MYVLFVVNHANRFAHNCRLIVRNSAAMKMTGHKTESIYQRYAIVGEAMLKEGASKLAALHADEKNGTREVASVRRRRPQ